MSRRNAEARRPAGATSARRRLTASLGDSGNGQAGDDPVNGNVNLPGLLAQGTGAAGREPFMYDGGSKYDGGPNDDGAAQRAGGSAEAFAGGGMHGPTKLRWRTGVRVAVLLGMLSLLLGGWFWWDVASSRPHVVPLSDVSTPEASGRVEEDGSSSSGGQAPGAASGAKIVVHVAGAVNKAGVVELPEGSRIHEAIGAAGGGAPGADLNRLNLAAVLADGQKIHVPQLGEPVDGPGAEPVDGAGGSGGAGQGGGPDGAGPGGTVDLNSATAEELGVLPRVGPVLAQRIVDWRKEHGRFSTVEELDAVDGVGPKMLETLLPLVRVS
ncbi:helix-hairpin-helix domain-containing protein [Arthrobacter sp. ISL-72]|uniref:helix-hairpin-helix domain-containing protein n=1 Tax=Arthrobacter sp. ISL-72 TaxID=2819114 RepID=UPI001BE8ED37|nr:helix-hairpin-helix domain-containing protein [Arthrobacter sp. ISL-72]MBT2594949.1 helix-hairpin-helix domain-containing protein [Arthrobacter sp. ISL-72]